jgi:putative ABC transport system permease protein
VLRTALRKMINNRWLTLLLGAGFVLVVALAAAIPLYTDGVLQKVLTADLEAAQAVDNVFPGNYGVRADFSSMEAGDRLRAFASLKKNLTAGLVPQIPLPVLTTTEEVTLASGGAQVPGKGRPGFTEANVFFRALAGMERHIRIVHGRAPAPAITDRTVEVIVTAGLLKENDFSLNDELLLKAKPDWPFARAKIVGVFEIADPRDTFWAKSPDFSTLYVSDALFEKEILGKGLPLLESAEWNFAFDYHALTLDRLGPMLAALDAQRALADRYRRSLAVEFRARPILDRYGERERQLRLALGIIDAPVLILLCFFIFMISSLVVSNERSEIAVLKSRGKSTGQIFVMYLYESLALALAALVLGPPLAWLLSRFMGASNGFLEFVRRAPLPAAFTPTTFLYAFAAALFLVAARLVPTSTASRVSIVELKRQSAREERPPLWKKLFVDFILLAASAYGLYRYQSREAILLLTGASTLDLGIDPLLFLTSTFFILGVGLLFLRVFPLLVRLVYRIGERRWSPVAYYALLQVGRTGGRGQFLMLFMIFSLAVGVFDAAMARTLNRNVEDRVRYAYGADIVLEPVWAEEGTVTARAGGPHMPPAGGQLSEEEEREAFNVSRHYREPPFTPYTLLEGVERATKVFATNGGKVAVGADVVTGVSLRGIIPYEFGQVSWFRNDLLPYHWYQYLNLLTDAPRALLVSRNFQTRFHLNAGDPLSLTWGDQPYAEGVIYAFVDYWPGFNSLAKTAAGGEPYLVVANLPFIQNKLAKDPYQVWLKKKPGVGDETVYRDIERRGLAVGAAAGLAQTLAAQKNDPLLKGVNATLTLGFLLIMAVCAAGFLMHWTISLRGRILQFGVLRAMGLSERRLVAMIVLEQLITSGTAALAGLAAGWLACRLFLPALELVFRGADQAPPFRIVALGSDALKILAIVLAVLALALVFLRFFLRRLKIGSALKLGEE